MYENHRDFRGDRRHDDQDPANRWRRGEDRYRREAQGDDDRFESNRRYREAGYGQTFRDDDTNWRGSQGGWRDQRGSYREHSGHDHASDADHHRDHNRYAGGSYGGTGDSSWFTGQQNSWAVAPSDRGRSYGGQSYGGQAYGYDYRPHGYDAGRYEDDHRRGFWDRATDEVASWFGDDEAARRRDADHRGRGPKDYVRSDERIRDDANDRLTEDWRVDASNITVSVQDGEVTLNGTVENRDGKRRAEDVVENISGVKHVQNNLRVAQTRTGEFASNWTLNQTSTAEGGTVSQDKTARGTTDV